MAMSESLFNNLAYGATGAATDDYLPWVNEVLEGIGEFPVPDSTVPTSSSGTMIHERALRFLERANMRVQAAGWPYNTEYAVKNTAALDDQDSLGTASGAPILFLQGSAKDGHRHLSLKRNDSDNPTIWDSDAGGVLTPSGSEIVFMDIVRKLRWNVLPESAKSHIASTAAMDMQRRLQGSPQADAFYQQERVLKDAKEQRNSPVRKGIPVPNPISLAAQQNQQQQPQQ
jgi:hypothetical protein